MASDNMVFEMKRIDPSILNRAHEYPDLRRGTKVLVTTGGPVANATVSRLTSAGCIVTVLAAADVPNSVSSTSEILVIRGSVMDREVCTKAVDGQDMVIHAGRPTSPTAVEGAGIHAKTSGHLVEGTKNLLDAATMAGVKCFIFLSSARYSSCVIP